jgi:hypothetical protein
MPNDVKLPFPIGGVSRSLPYSQQGVETTPHAENVVPYDVSEHRFRGGSRPGFQRLSSINMGGPPVFMVSFPSPPVEGESFRLSFVAGTADDLFVNQTGQATVGDDVIYTEEFIALAGVFYTEDESGLGPYTYIDSGGFAYVRPDGGMYVRPGFDEGIPWLTEDDEEIQTASFGFGGQRTDAAAYQGGVVVPGSGDVILEGYGSLSGGVLIGDGIADWLEAGAKVLEHVVELLPTEGSTLVPATYTIRFDLGAQLFVASGTNAGRCTFRVVDGPKMIIAVNRSVLPIESTVGNIPIGASLVATYLDRLVFVKDRVWYMSRQGDSGDWDYFADADDLGRAVAGVSSDAGLPGDPITALASRGNDYLLMFGNETTWVMRGDPAAGGVLENLSRTYGAIDSRSWCYGDEGEIYFLSKQGFCVIADGAGSRPALVSSAFLPNELRNVDPAMVSVSMVFDVRYRGVWIFLTPAEGNATHYFFSKQGNSFWPIQFASAGMQATAATIHASDPSENSVVLIGDRSGTIRRAVAGQQDDANAIQSSIVFGPYLSSETGWRHGLVTQLSGMLGGESSSVVLSIFAGNSPEDAANKAVTGSTPSFTTNLSGLRANTFKPRIRNVAFCVRIDSTDAWVFESLMASISDAGQARL